MKKRTIKDFIALYNSEEEEKLVLIQSGSKVIKTAPAQLRMVYEQIFH